jgi:hypothetical protein
MDHRLLEVTVKRLSTFSHRHVPAHQDISRDEIDIWGRAHDCDIDAKAFWKKEEAAFTLVTWTDLCDEPWSLWIQGEKLSSNVNGNMYNFIHDPESALSLLFYIR